MQREPIAPGLHRGIPLDRYLRLDAYGRSDLEWAVTHTLAHFKHHWDNDEPSPSTPDQQFGALLHKAILEPEDLAARIAPAPINEKTGKAYGRDTKAWAEAEALRPGRILATIEDRATIEWIRRRAADHPIISQMVSRVSAGVCEVVAVWDDPATGLRCKARADWYVAGVAIIDPKSTACAAPRPFGRDAAKFGYHRQAVHYRDGFAIAEGIARGQPPADPDPFVLVAFEKEPPYEMAVYTFAPAELDTARAELDLALNNIADARAGKPWAGYPRKVLPLELPAWAVPHVESMQ